MPFKDIFLENVASYQKQCDLQMAFEVQSKGVNHADYYTDFLLFMTLALNECSWEPKEPSL